MDHEGGPGTVAETPAEGTTTWWIADRIRYAVTNGASSKEVLITVEDRSPEEIVLRITVAGEDSEVISHFDPRTGRLINSTFPVTGVTQWNLRSASQLPSPGGSSMAIHAASMIVPLGPQWPIMRGEPTGEFGFLSYGLEKNATDWNINGSAPCAFHCTLLEGQIATRTGFQFEGETGQVYPQSATIWLDGEAIDSSDSPRLEMKMLSRSGSGLNITGIQEPSFAPLFNHDQCIGVLCESGQEPPRYSIQAVQSKIESSLEFQEWNGSQGGNWFPQSLGVGGPYYVKSDGNEVPPLAQFQGTMATIDLNTGASATFSLREYEVDETVDGPVETVRIIGQDTKDLRFYPESPWKDTPLQPLNRYYERIEADTGKPLEEFDIWVTARNPANNPDPAYKIIFLFIWNQGSPGQSFSLAYSGATGELIQQRIPV